MLRLCDPSVERIPQPQHAYSLSATLHTAGTLEPGHSLVQCEINLHQIEGSLRVSVLIHMYFPQMESLRCLAHGSVEKVTMVFDLTGEPC